RCVRRKAPSIYGAEDRCPTGRGKVHGPGNDVAIIACGLLEAQALIAQSQLEDEGIAARVIDMHTLKPLDEPAVARAARECGAIVTAEEHVLEGGLGSLVAKAVALSTPVPMEFVGIQNTFAESGAPD